MKVCIGENIPRKGTQLAGTLRQDRSWCFGRISLAEREWLGGSNEQQKLRSNSASEQSLLSHVENSGLDSK